jgi:hypothetical protein
MSARVRLLISALIFLACTLAGARLARVPSELALYFSGALAAAGIVSTAAIVPTSTFSRGALLGAGAILATCILAPVAFVADRSGWLREAPSLLGYLWLWLFCVGLPYPAARTWCRSTPVLLIAAALLGGSLVASALW